MHTVEGIVREKARIAGRGESFVLEAQRYVEVVSTVMEEVLKIGGDDIEVWRQRECDASMDGDGEQMFDFDDSFSIRTQDQQIHDHRPRILARPHLLKITSNDPSNLHPRPCPLPT